MQAFDGKRGSKWLDFGAGGGGPAWLEAAATDPVVGARLVGYTLLSAGDAPERDPRDWVLEGLPCGSASAAGAVAGADGSALWVGLDAQRGATFAGRCQELHYKVMIRFH